MCRIDGGAKDSSGLVLIGVVHADPQGYTRALELLNRFAPDLITVEISPFSLRYRQRHERGWQRQLARVLEKLPPEAASHLAIQRLAAQICLPFEVKAARAYARKCSTPWCPVDQGSISRRHLPRYGSELLKLKNLAALVTMPNGSLAVTVAAEYRRAHRAIRENPRRLPTAGSRENLRREGLMVRRLFALTAKYGRVVHLGGWEHLVAWQEQDGLWAALAALKPVRLLLDEAELAH